MSATGTATLNFGANPGSNEATVSVTDASILGSSLADAWIVAVPTSDHGTKDHAYARLLIGVCAGAPVAGVGFTIYAASSEKMVGTFTVNWVWV